MAKRQKLGYALGILLVCAFPVGGQVLPTPAIEPVPIPGGDILPPLFNQFFPGIGTGFDGQNADPHGITNFSGIVAMGYTNGTATDNANNNYQVITDIRVYRGDYVGAQSTFGAGGTTSGKAHGTFVEI
jgi:hypothetical protein